MINVESWCIRLLISGKDHNPGIAVPVSYRAVHLPKQGFDPGSGFCLVGPNKLEQGLDDARQLAYFLGQQFICSEIMGTE